MTQGIHPKWYAHFPDGKYIKDDGTSDEDYWEAIDKKLAAERSQWASGKRVETAEETRDRVLREMGF